VAPIRIPSDLRPVSENRSFAEGPALAVAPPVLAPLPPLSEQPAKQAAAGDFTFDFGFGSNSAKAPVQPPSPPANDPIGDLIAAEIGGPKSEPDIELAPEPEGAPQAQVTPVAPQPQPSRPAMVQVTPGGGRPLSSAPIPLKPVSVAPRSAESDRFSIAPAASIAPTPNQPLAAPQVRRPDPAPMSAETDPMAEIESLIGEAVRVELSTPGPMRVQVSTPEPATARVDVDDAPRSEAPPVVPPLNAQFAPRRSGLRDDGPATSAEEAILAAAAATGTPVGRVDPSTADDRPYRRLKVKSARPSILSNSMRQYVGMAVAGTLLLAAGLGLYWVFNMGRTPDNGASAPQLTADATPIKVKPDATASAEPDTARSPVLAQMEGSASQSETLATTDDTASNPLAVTADTPRDVTADAADSTEGGLANRKVRTVTVRPDGTIVSGDDAVAGTEEMPIDRPNVPVVPGSASVAPSVAPVAVDPIASTIADNAASAASSVEPLAPVTANADSSIPAVFDPTLVAPKPITFPVRSEATRTLGFSNPPTNPVNAVVADPQTPDGQVDLLATDAQPVKQPARPAAPATASTAAAYVQLASSLTEAEANGAVKSATAKWGSLFGGNSLVVQKADLGAKGIRFRVRLPAASLADATRICAEIKAQGGDCFATNS
jgi:hypothetical protein